MTKDEAYEKQRRERIALERENKKLKARIEEYDKKRGAQPGHEKHSLAPLCDDEITTSIQHTLEQCPDCGSENLIYIEKKGKDVIDYEVVLKKVRNEFYVYECTDCGHIVRSKIPMHLKESVQYGANIQALGLALQNIGFVSVNRTKKLMNSFLGNGISLSEGFLCKLQKRALSISE